MTGENDHRNVPARRQSVTRSRWFMPLFCLSLGMVVLAASWLGGQMTAGLYGLSIMTAFGLVLFLLSVRSETLRGLTTGRDERFAQIDLRATAVTGLVLLSRPAGPAATSGTCLPVFAAAPAAVSIPHATGPGPRLASAAARTERADAAAVRSTAPSGDSAVSHSPAIAAAFPGRRHRCLAG